ncbi:MAG: Gfo/Idh/MocA family protein [Clostridia bacterium]|jgi:predicted dehydrogenase|nr:Gfo/Idh/MocA family oxidoreductase [Clostridiaceae bacterium]
MTVNVAVIGLGHNGLAFCEEYAKNPKSRLIAVCDIDQERAKYAGEKFHAAVYTDYSVLDIPELDAVSIHTGDSAHKEPFLLSLKKGKHVFVEKPMANRIEDVLEMVQEAEKHPNLVSQVGQVLRFVRQYAAIKRLVDSGFFGEIAYLEADYIHDLRYQYFMEKWKVTDEIPMVGGGCHPLDLMRWYAGEVTEVNAISNHITYKEMREETSIVATYKFKSGAIGKVTCLYGSPGPCPDMYNLKIYGTKASLVQRKICIDALGSMWIDLPSELFIPSHPYGPEVDHFLDCITKGIECAVPAWDGGMSAIATLLAAESAKDGEKKYIPSLR